METLGEVLTLLARDDVGPVENDRAELARRLLPTVLKTATVMIQERGTEEHPSSSNENIVVSMRYSRLLN